MDKGAEPLAADDRGDLAVLARLGRGHVEALDIRREVIAVGGHVKGDVQHFGRDVEIADRKDRVAVGAHQVDQRLAHLGLGGVFHVEDTAEDAVHGEQDRGLVDQTEGDAHVHQPHQIRAAAQDHAAVDDALHAAAGEIFKVFDVADAAAVALHQSAERQSRAAARGGHHAAGIGDDARRILVGKNADRADFDRSVREKVAVGDDQVFALADVAHAGPAGDRRAAGEDAHRAEKERQGIAAHRSKGDGGAEGHREYVENIRDVLLQKGDQQRQSKGENDKRQRDFAEEILVGGGLLAAADKAERGTDGFKDRHVARAAVRLAGNGKAALADRRNAQRLAHRAGVEHGGEHFTRKGERGNQTQGEVRGAHFGLGHKDRVERSDEAGGDGHAVGAEFAAHGVHDAGRDHVETQEHDPKLQPETDRVGDNGGLEHTGNGKPERDPRHDEQQNTGDAQAQPHRADMAAVILGSLGAAELAPEILVVVLHRARAGSAAAAHAVENGGETGEKVFPEAAGIGRFFIKIVVIGGRGLVFALYGVIALLKIGKGRLELYLFLLGRELLLFRLFFDGDSVAAAFIDPLARRRGPGAAAAAQKTRDH